MSKKITMTDAEYRLLPAINYSNLKHMRKSPLHYRHKVDAGEDVALSAKLAWFRAVHTLVLEPFAFQDEYVVYLGKRDRRTKMYKAFLAEHPGRSVLSLDEHDRAMTIASSVNEHPWVAEMLAHEGTETEVVMVWDDASAGPCKGKADLLHYSEEHGLIVADLKTFSTTDGRQIARTGAQYGWHIQFAHYLHGAAHHFGLSLADVPYKCLSIVVEADAPHDVTVCEWDEVSIDHALAQHRGLLDHVAVCERSQRWPGRAALQTISIPDYLL